MEFVDFGIPDPIVFLRTTRDGRRAAHDVAGFVIANLNGKDAMRVGLMRPTPRILRRRNAGISERPGSGR